MLAGTTKILKVVREAPFGFFLTDGDNDVLLHHTEVSHEIEIDEELEVFLYQDHDGRLAATLTIPTIQVGTFDWAPVAGVNKRLGVFINIGLQKDMLISLDDLPESSKIWPQIGDRLYCTLTRNNKDRLFAAFATEEEMAARSVPADQSLFNKSIKGTIYRINDVGASFITEEGYVGFIHSSEQNGVLRLGQEIEGRITNVKTDGTLNASLLPRNYERLGNDAESIYEYLLNRGGSMPYSDQSMPEDIMQRFNMSKGAFKRALGKLMKEKKITQKDGWTYTNQE